MANDYIQLGGLNGYPSTFKFRPIIRDITSSAQKEDVVITCIASYQANIYVGTSLGHILHYHHLDDAYEYIMISQLQISQDKKPVKKILILPHIERALVLCGEIASVYSIPELSPSHIGKLKQIVDLLYLSGHSPSKNSEVQAGADYEEVLILAGDKIRVIQVSTKQIKLLKDISYPNAIKCAAFSFLNIPDHSSLAVVANDKNYDIIDLKQTRKVPLFDYHANTDDGIKPQIIPFFPSDDKTSEELLLTIKSDESTSMSMFINSSGDVTRGTLLWPSGEHPTNGIAIEWPYVFAICKSNNRESKMIVASLMSLETEFSCLIQDLLNSSANQDCITNVVAGSSHIEKKEIETDKASGATDVPSKELDDVPPETSSKSEDDLPESKDEEYKILKLYQSIEFNDDELSNLLDKINIKDGSILHSTSTYSIGSTTIVYKKSSIWIMYEINQIIYLTKKIHEISPGSSDLEEIKNISNLLKDIIPKCTYELHDYSIQLLFLLYLWEGNYSLCIQLSFQTIENNSSNTFNLNLDPRFVIFVLDDIHHNDALLLNFQIFKELNDVNQLLFGKTTQDDLLIDYVEKFYTEFLINTNDTDEELLKYCRMKLYEKKMSSSMLLIDFIDHYDKDMWKAKGVNNDSILELLKNSDSYFGLLAVYLILIENSDKCSKVEISKEISDISLKLLNEELSDPDVTKPVTSEINFNNVSFNLLELILSQLNENLQDEKAYSKYLLEVMKFNPSVALKFMKANNNKQKATHRRIMEEMPESFSKEVDFSRLRLEYMESSFLESLESDLDLEALDEFLIELTKDIVSKLEDSNKNNFNILHETYQIENSLNDSKWPKISWPDYLRFNMKRSECQNFIETYLKIIELLIVRVMNQDSLYVETLNKFEDIISTENTFSYFKLIYCQRGESITRLLNFSDYSSAEYITLYNEFPLPVSACYFKHSKYVSLRDRSSYKHNKSNLVNLFKFYITRENDFHQNFPAIQHFISSYGILFTVEEMLSMLPSHYPIIYLQDYLRNVVIDINADHRDADLKKILSKVDAKFTRDLCNDLAYEEHQ